MRATLRGLSRRAVRRLNWLGFFPGRLGMEGHRRKTGRVLSDRGVSRPCVPLRDEVEMNDKLNAVIELVSELGLAFGAPLKPGKEREPFIDALVAVARFARAVGSHEADWGLTVLAYTLQDLDVGIVGPLVRPGKRKGREPTRQQRDLAHASSGVGRLGGAAEVRHDAREGNALHQFRISQAPTAHDARKGPARYLIKRWRRELEEAKQDTFLATFAQLMIDMEEDVKNMSSSRPMNSDRWRQSADKMLASIQP